MEKINQNLNCRGKSTVRVIPGNVFNIVSKHPERSQAMYLQKADRFLNKWFTTPSIDWKQSFAIVLPYTAEYLFTVLFGLLNTGMISSSGTNVLSAVSLVDSLNNFLVVFYPKSRIISTQ